MPNCDYKKESLTTIIILAQNRDIKALECLIRREQKHIYAIFSHLTDKKEDVADLTQETLVKMARNLKSLKEPSHFRQWLNRIISNTFYDYYRKERSSLKNRTFTAQMAVKAPFIVIIVSCILYFLSSQ